MNIYTEIHKLQKLIKSVRCSATEVLLSTDVQNGDAVTGCYKFAINTTTNNIFFKSSSSTWEILVAGSDNPNTEVISGGIVTWLQDYDYNISEAIYKINGVTYSSPSTNVTLAASDPLLDRIDTFALTTSGTAIVLTGVPDTNPSSPTPNPVTEIAIGIALVTAGSTAPTSPSPTLWQITGNNIYNTNIGNVGIGTLTPAHKLHVVGECYSTTGFRVSGATANKTGIYSDVTNELSLWAGNGKVLSVTRGGLNTGAINTPISLIEQLGTASGYRAFWNLSSNVQSSLSANGVDFIQLLSQPNINQSTFGTGKVRFIYYNPSIATLNSSQHIAWENTSGDIIHRNLSGTGDRTVIVDSIGKLKTGPLATVAGNDTEIQFNDGGNMGTDPDFVYDKSSKTLRLTSSLLTQLASFNGVMDSMYFSVGFIVPNELGWYLGSGDQAVAIYDTALSTFYYGNKSIFYDDGAKAVGIDSNVYNPSDPYGISFRMGGTNDGFFFTGTLNGINNTPVLQFVKSSEVLQIGDIAGSSNSTKLSIDIINDQVTLKAKTSIIDSGLVYAGKEVFTNHH